MSTQKTAGLFLIDTRLLSTPKYVSFINESLFKFYLKYPHAYFTLIVFDDTCHSLLHFQKIQTFFRLQLTIPSARVKVFDAIGQTLENFDWLFSIYEISCVHVWIAAMAKDQGSTQYCLSDILNIIQKKQQAHWKFYFPFAGFESLSNPAFFSNFESTAVR